MRMIFSIALNFALTVNQTLLLSAICIVLERSIQEIVTETVFNVPQV